MENSPNFHLRVGTLRHLDGVVMPSHPEGVAAQIRKLDEIAEVLGIKADIKNLTVRESLAAIDRKIEALIELTKPIENSRNMSAQEFLEKLKERGEALKVLVKLERIIDPGPSAAERLRFRKHFDGLIEITLPYGSSIREMGRELNAEALRRTGRGIGSVVDMDPAFWSGNEVHDIYQMRPGQTYKFRLSSNSAPQGGRGSGLAPLGAIALAELCMRLESGESLVMDGDSGLVSGATPDAAIDLRTLRVFESDALKEKIAPSKQAVLEEPVPRRIPWTGMF